MNQSETLGKLAKALAIVQGQLRPADENANNPFFKSKYADLGSIIKVSRNLLADNGLSVSQFPGETLTADGAKHYATLTTILMHESGEWLSQDLTMPLAKVDSQGYGSAITYARRYALASVLGIYAGEDDDASAATEQATSGPTYTKELAPETPTTSQAENGSKPLMAPVKFVEYTQDKLGYTSPEHVRATMALIGFKTVPNDPSNRKRMYEALKEYRAYRKAEMSQEDALQAMADREVQDAT